MKKRRGIRRFARLESVLAALCLLTPAALIWSDGTVRDSISAYYSIAEAQLFYVPLTVVAMLFLVNGTIKRRHRYNSILGLLLFGVIFFNHIDYSTLHSVLTIAFFFGNALVILVYSSHKERWFKALLVMGIALATAGCVLNWYSVFWGEWMSLSIIALHYILESQRLIWELDDGS